MKVVVNEQLGIQEIEIIINCSSKDETVQKIVSSLSVIDMKLTCRKDDEIFQLDPANILYIESVDRKTFLYTEQQIFPYYSAEFLNLWMKSDNDDILEQLYQDWEGTAIHSQVVLDFYKQIKSECPETVFHGTDVGHQYQSTGERYLAYLQETGQSSSSEQYQLAQEAIEQGQHYYQYSDDVYRENTMTENFIREFDRLNGVDVMGIYGAAHIGIDALDYTTNTIPCMANQLHERYGDVVHAENLTLVHDVYTVDTVQIGEKEYSAFYFGKTDLSAILPDYQCREFWRLENAYDDFKDCPTTGNVLPYDNYPMEIEVGQIFMIKYTKADGSVITEYHRSDGHTWRGELATEEFSIDG